ncbi:putative urease accessory protein UreF-like [Rhypophila decipiens]
MSNWALKRNADPSRDAPGPDDTTQLDAPDTPAPVFAVRALKTALFGTPAPRAHDRSEQTRAIPSDKTASMPEKSPIKPPGILLTPGTGTTRRKRVSFGHGVKEGAAVQTTTSTTTGATTTTSTSGLPDECPGKFPSPWVGDSEKRPKTRLTEALENSRTVRISQPCTDAKDSKDSKAVVNRVEEVWSEDEDLDDESDRDPDVTVDLNEPHSRSGKYWKSYFESYHADAKTEMEKLVKYKQLAKSYAKKKDAEALELNEKLKEEQERVKQMENKVAELSRQVALSKKRGGNDSSTSLMVQELARQKELALEYKKQVEELEALVPERPDADDVDGLSKQLRIASPRTQKTLIETQKELRKARSQARELDKIREERDRLRSELKFAEQRSAKLIEENKRLSTELSESTKTRDTEKKLDRELKKLRADYEKLKEDSKARYTEAHQVLKKKNDTIAELQEEIRSLKASAADAIAPRRRASREKALTADDETVGKTRPRARSSTDIPKRSSYEDEKLTTSRTLREKIEHELGKKPSTVLSDRGNLQDSRSSASSGVSQPSAYTKPISSHGATSRAAERASWTPASTQTKHHLPITATQDDTNHGHGWGENDDFPTTTKPAIKTLGRQTRRLTVRPPTPEREAPKVDLVEDNFARLGASTTTTHNSTMWTVDVSRASNMPPERRTAAMKRVAAKRAKREQERLEQQRLLQEQQQQQVVGPNHFLFLLCDSALPLGSFAFSSGLESYLAHAKHSFSQQQPSSFASFLPLSLSSYASTTLPFVLAAYRDPSRLPELDDTLDATIICTVGRRASVAQGRALLSIYDRAFASSFSSSILKSFSAQLRKQSNNSGSYSSSPNHPQTSGNHPPEISAHLAPLFGVIGAQAGLSCEQTAYIFMLGHVKALVSAAVRAGMFGPYQAQKTLAGPVVPELVADMIQREWDTPVEEAGQSVPVMDLWFGRHETLYSRIFNS